jgi:hypothetical protein
MHLYPSCGLIAKPLLKKGLRTRPACKNAARQQVPIYRHQTPFVPPVTQRF